MSKREFMEQLETLLADIPDEEREEALAYYYGYFEDAGVENEENIIRELKSPEKVAETIKADISVDEMEYTETGYQDMPLKEQEVVVAYTGSNAEHKIENNNDKTLKIVLIVLLALITCPIWLGIVGGIGGVLVGILGTIFGMLIALIAGVFALYVSGVVMFGIGVGLLVSANLAAGISIMGVGCILLTFAVLGTMLCMVVCGKFLPWLVKGIISLCKRVFGRKEKVA